MFRQSEFLFFFLVGKSVPSPREADLEEKGFLTVLEWSQGGVGVRGFLVFNLMMFVHHEAT